MDKQTEDKKIELATTIYREVCNNIRTTDEISFRLLGLVPLLSAAGIFGISLDTEFSSSPLAVVISIFAATVTGALFMWEWRNIKSCRSYLSYAMILEKHVFYNALGLDEKMPSVKMTDILGIYLILHVSFRDILRGKTILEEIFPSEKERKIALGQFRSRPDTKVIRKTIAEIIIYSATICAWLAIAIRAIVI